MFKKCNLLLNFSRFGTMQQQFFCWKVHINQNKLEFYIVKKYLESLYIDYMLHCLHNYFFRLLNYFYRYVCLFCSGQFLIKRAFSQLWALMVYNFTCDRKEEWWPASQYLGSLNGDPKLSEKQFLPLWEEWKVNKKKSFSSLFLTVYKIINHL